MNLYQKLTPCTALSGTRTGKLSVQYVYSYLPSMPQSRAREFTPELVGWDQTTFNDENNLLDFRSPLVALLDV